MIEFEEGSGNIYADLGMPDADVLGLTQPKLSKMLRGQFRGISEAKMLDCLTRLGRNVQIVVGPARRSDQQEASK
ncbi:MAG: helix-turn-helix domain-containing protein [Janthinobacterium lividum]